MKDREKLNFEKHSLRLIVGYQIYISPCIRIVEIIKSEKITSNIQDGGKNTGDFNKLQYSQSDRNE